MAGEQPHAEAHGGGHTAAAIKHPPGPSDSCSSGILAGPAGGPEAKGLVDLLRLPQVRAPQARGCRRKPHDAPFTMSGEAVALRAVTWGPGAWVFVPVMR